MRGDRMSFETLSGVKRNDKTNSNNNNNMKNRDDDDEKKNRNKRTNTFLLHILYMLLWLADISMHIHTMLLLHSLLLSPSSQPKKTTYRHKNTNTITWTQTPVHRAIFSSLLPLLAPPYILS